MTQSATRQPQIPKRLSNLASRTRHRQRTTLTIRSIASGITNQQGTIEFEYMVKTELPQHAATILQSAQVADRAMALAKVIAEEYFPVNEMAFDAGEWYDEGRSWYHAIQQTVPWYAFGYNWEDLHEFGSIADAGYMIGGLLIPEADLDAGLRSNWLEEVQSMISVDTARRLWQAPWRTHEVFDQLEHTKHRMVAQIPNQILNWHDNPFLYSNEDLSNTSMSTDYWRAHNLADMAQHWTIAERVLEQAATAAAALHSRPEESLLQILPILEDAAKARNCQ